jgi:DNA-binding IclR family transcriptional regulator
MLKEDTTCVRSLVRALSLLDVLASNPAKRSLRDVARAAGIPPSTTHRLLHSLQQKGYVAQDPITSEYGLGESLILLGRKAEQQRNVRTVARPHLEKLAQDTCETVNLTTVVDSSVVQLDHVDSPNMLKVTWDSGKRFPIHASASGKVFLAFLPVSERKRILNTIKPQAFTKRTIVDPAKWLAELRAIRERGFALDDAEREEGVRCVAAPVFDAKGAVIAAVSISGPSMRLSLPKLHKLASLVLETCRMISSSLGYRDEEHGQS